MEKKSFQMLFLRMCLISLLFWGSAAFDTDFSEEHEQIKILMTSKGGLQFSKKDTPDGRKIIYDCNLGLRNKGTIYAFDQIHPDDMKALIIENCEEIRVVFNYESRFYKFQELKINNVDSLVFSREYYNVYTTEYYNFKAINALITNVGFFNMDGFLDIMCRLGLSLKLQNVLIDTVPEQTDTKCDFHLETVHLKNVKVNKIARRGIHSKSRDSFLTVEDSHFEDVHKYAFDFQGKVKIINNTFSFLDEAAFSVNTSESFVFSGNHVKRMLNPFYISAPEVNIINNTFDSITMSFLSNIIASTNPSFFTVLNVTGNRINQWSRNLFSLDVQNATDIIIFEDNYLNCTCKNLDKRLIRQGFVADVFFNKERKNFCNNLGNCPLHKSLEKAFGICSGTFRCPADDQIEDCQNTDTCPHLKSILSVLKNIDIKLDQIVTKFNSSLVNTSV